MKKTILNLCLLAAFMSASAVQAAPHFPLSKAEDLQNVAQESKTSKEAEKKTATPTTASTAAGGNAAAKPKEADKKPKIEELVKDTQAYHKGPIDVFLKDKKWYALIDKKRLGESMWLSVNMSKGLGSMPFFTGTLGPSYLIEWEQDDDIVRLRVKPTYYKDPHTRAQKGFEKDNQKHVSDGLLAAYPIVTQNDEKIVIEAQGLLLSDHMRLAEAIERSWSTGYGLDVKNSRVLGVQSNEQELRWGAEQHFFAPKLPANARGHVGALAQSLLPQVQVSLRALPKQLMPVRSADERLGYFTIQRFDSTGTHWYGFDSFITRWDLTPKSSGADSEQNVEKKIPKEPIRIYVCPDVPEQYVQAVKNGIGMWSSAFEKAGWSADTLQVHSVQSMSDLPLGENKMIVCWYAASGANAAFGPSKVDPRSGQILEAHVLMPNVFVRQALMDALDVLESKSAHEKQTNALDEHSHESWYAIQKQYLSELLVLKDQKEFEQRAQEYVRMITAHEVGHALGLRHNFKSTFAVKEPLNKEKPQSVGSVMGYIPLSTLGTYISPMDQVGQYDQMAIEYGYRWFGDSDKQQQEGLEQWKQLFWNQWASNPAWHYASDEQRFTSALVRLDAKPFTLGKTGLDWRQKAKQNAQKQVHALIEQKQRQEYVDPLKVRLALGGWALRSSEYLDAAQDALVGAYTQWRGQKGADAQRLSVIDVQAQRQALQVLEEYVISRPIDATWVELARWALPDGRYVRFGSSPWIDVHQVQEQWSLEVLQWVSSEAVLEQMDTVHAIDPKRMNSTQWLEHWGKVVWNGSVQGYAKSVWLERLDQLRKGSKDAKVRFEAQGQWLALRSKIAILPIKERTVLQARFDLLDKQN